MAAKLINLLALSSLAILLSSFGALPTANALSVDPHNVARHLNAGHDGFVKRNRTVKRAPKCKNKPKTSSAAPKSTPKPAAKPAPKTSNKSPSGSTVPTPGNGGGSTGGGKVGIAWANGDSADLAKFKTSKVGPIYTWSPYIPSNAKSLGFQAAPMLWGPKQIGDFTKLVKPGYANIALGFNEPNQAGQSDISPQYGAQLWKQYLQPLAHQGYQLGSPACTNAPSGMTWMKDFFAACNGCTFDFVTLHFYGTSSDLFIAYLQTFHNTFHLPVWPTEYACQNFGGGAQCTKDGTFAFHAKVQGFMDSQSWVPHYFPFGFMQNMVGVNPDNQLMAPNGGPSALGAQYIY